VILALCIRGLAAPVMLDKDFRGSTRGTDLRLASILAKCGVKVTFFVITGLITKTHASSLINLLILLCVLKFSPVTTNKLEYLKRA
jgi:hypothetical protein